MKINWKILPFISLLILGIIASGCDTLAPTDDSALQASGVVEAVEMVVAPEIGGRIAEVLVEEGDAVTTGDTLFRITDETLGAQYQQALAAHEAALAGVDTANAGLETAQASVDAAQAQVDSLSASIDAAKAAVEVAKAGLTSAENGVDLAQVQYDMELVAARLADLPNRVDAWNKDAPSEFEQPVWYFQKDETIAAAKAQIDAALEALDNEQANYDSVLAESGNGNLIDAETRLAEAQAAFLIADELRDREIEQNGKDSIDDYIQTIYDSALAELDAAQSEFDQLLSDQDADNVLEARARLVAAKERYNISVDYYNSLLTGEDSLSLEAAQLGVTQAESVVGQAEAQVAQAEAGVAQAEAGLALLEANLTIAQANVNQAEAGVAQAEKMADQAKAALTLIETQMEKLTISAAVSGVVMTRNVEPGEVILPGATALTIAQLDKLTITVYLPEDKYGQVSLGDRASLAVDSFPGETFEGSVTRISDQAEYTPRNVQTKEDRQTTVYAVELTVKDPNGKLKPGMPTDVTFGK